MGKQNTYQRIRSKYITRMRSVNKNDAAATEVFEQLVAGKTSYLRMDRVESSSLDMNWILKIEDCLYDLGQIVQNPKRNTKTLTSVVPVELARKTGAESIRHLASHSENVKEIDENGNVTPSKVLTIYSDDDYSTYENRFIATLIRRLVLFVEKRYSFIKDYAPLKQVQALYFKNKSMVDGQTVEIETKIKVSRPNEDMNNGDDGSKYLLRIEEIRKYLRYYYTSDFMKMLKTEKNVRNPILQTNIIRKNPQYHKCYELYRFIEKYENVGLDYKVREKYSKLTEDEMDEINRTILANFLTLKGKEPSRQAKKEVLKKYKPKILTSLDDELFIYGPLFEGPIEFLRVDQPYLEYANSISYLDIPERPSKEEKEYYADEIEEKKARKLEDREDKKLIARKKKEKAQADKYFDKVVDERLKEEEAERQRLAALQKQEEDNRLEAARQALIAAAIGKEESSKEEPIPEPVAAEEPVAVPEPIVIEKTVIKEVPVPVPTPVSEPEPVKEEPLISLPHKYTRTSSVNEDIDVITKRHYVKRTSKFETPIVEEASIVEEPAPVVEETPVIETLIVPEPAPVVEEVVIEPKPKRKYTRRVKPVPVPVEESVEEKEPKKEPVPVSKIPGKFIFKANEGYYISKGKYSNQKTDAHVFDDFNEANALKQAFGGKVVKIGNAELASFAIKEEAPVKKEKPKAERKPKIEIVPKPVPVVKEEPEPVVEEPTPVIEEAPIIEPEPVVEEPVVVPKPKRKYTRHPKPVVDPEPVVEETAIEPIPEPAPIEEPAKEEAPVEPAPVVEPNPKRKYTRHPKPVPVIEEESKPVKVRKPREKKEPVALEKIPGKFILKANEGYYIRKGKFSNQKSDAHVFDDFNDANKLKQSLGGKVVKIGGAELASFTPKEAVPVKKEKRKYVRKPKVEAVPTPIEEEPVVEESAPVVEETAPVVEEAPVLIPEPELVVEQPVAESEPVVEEPVVEPKPKRKYTRRPKPVVEPEPVVEEKAPVEEPVKEEIPAEPKPKRKYVRKVKPEPVPEVISEPEIIPEQMKEEKPEVKAKKPKPKAKKKPAKKKEEVLPKIPGKFILKTNDGYYMKNGKYSVMKNDAFIFDDFNAANKLKQLRGGKIVKL